MNHLRNIKEMMSIPTGSRNVSTSGYSSFTDSQLFFGTQFWPENSQGMSQDMSLSSRNSQQSSQEGSDPKFSSSYPTKPLLFGELKDKNKGFGLLHQFEEDRKRAKESDILAKECSNFREALDNIQQLVAGTEKHTAVCQTILQRFDNFASTLQNSLNSLQSDISQQFETLLKKVNSQKNMMTELEERVQKVGDTTAELGSDLQSLKKSLECLREEQERERSMLEEVLKLLSTLVSEHSAKPSPKRVVDSAIQMSPGLEEPFSNIRQDNKLEGTRLRRKFQDPGYIVGKKKFAPRDHRMRKKTPQVLPQRRKRTATDENSQRLKNKQNASTPLCKRRDPNAVTSPVSLNSDCAMPPKRSVTEEYLITPFTCSSQDSNSSVCLAEVEPILEKLSAESKTETKVKPESLWQLFDMDGEF